ncbi:uncharacterized protein BDR25DRAFT_355103 [Lindgomyces ingoldianus]|uniref:Uncharacterized protein n=1 Tax=Lindgomyces ingoldianus TaxID=673940 RepID=A0ACB6QX12_9PLEO|nr:uncharacterized protein BDR25DRAFT_355103 [Lindgomyces ingoldianus]KAF2470617.1 hypothetical protein BDR25DRAFT_355103 [Lindgomyces ingoldianus]
MLGIGKFSKVKPLPSISVSISISYLPFQPQSPLSSASIAVFSNLGVPLTMGTQSNHPADKQTKFKFYIGTSRPKIVRYLKDALNLQKRDSRSKLPGFCEEMLSVVDGDSLRLSGFEGRNGELASLHTILILTSRGYERRTYFNRWRYTYTTAITYHSAGNGRIKELRVYVAETNVDSIYIHMYILIRPQAWIVFYQSNPYNMQHWIRRMNPSIQARARAKILATFMPILEQGNANSFEPSLTQTEPKRNLTQVESKKPGAET